MIKGSVNYYKSADTLPIFNFMKCKDGDLRYLYKCDIDNLPDKCPEKFNEYFLEILYDLDGLDLSVIRMVYNIARYDNNYTVTKDKKWLNKRNLLQADYKRRIEINKEEKVNFMEQVGVVENFLKREIDVYKCSTRKYFGYVQQMRNNG